MAPANRPREKTELSSHCYQATFRANGKERSAVSIQKRTCLGLVVIAAIIGAALLPRAFAQELVSGRRPKSPSPNPPAASGTAIDKFVAIDTSRLMGSPDGQPALGVEKAFPHVTFVRPVEFTHAGDNSDRVFVVE